MEDTKEIVKKTLRDSVFTDLFKIPKYLLELYEVLHPEDTEVTENDLKDILCEIKREDVSRVTFKTEQLKKYFPKDYTVEKMKREIIDILKIWMDKYWDL